MQNDSYQEGGIKVKDNKNLIRNLNWLFWYLTAREIDKTRITIAIMNEIGEEVELWIIPPSDIIPECKDCLIFKAEDFDKLDKLFRPTPITKNRKNK